MSDELLKRVNRMCELIGESHDGYMAIVGGPMERLLIDCGERVRELEDECHYRGCLVRDLLPYQDRAVKAEAERDALRALLREALPYLRTSGWGNPGVDLPDRIDAALKGSP